MRGTIYLAVAALFLLVGCSRAAPPPVATPRAGSAAQDLGAQSLSFGSQGQAQALLRLMQAQPGRATYSISYHTDVDTVTVSCDLTQDTLRRNHYQTDGHGSTEDWQGYVLARLQAGAGGGSLNSTPAGQSFATRNTF